MQIENFTTFLLYNFECLFNADAVLLSGNHSSPEGTLGMDCEMEKNPSTSRKRRSLNIMLRDRSAKKARSTVEEDVEDQNEVHEDQNEEADEDQNEGADEDQNEAYEDMDILSSPASSGADPMVNEAIFVVYVFAQVDILCICAEITF